MHQTKLVLIPVLGLSLYAVGSLAHAQGIDEALAAVHAALTGRWEGQVEGVNPITGEGYRQPDTFTFVVTGADGLDAAWWTDVGLILYEHRGGGNYHARTYGPQGAGFEEDLNVSVPQPVDDRGTGSWIVTGQGEMPDGTEIEIREVFSLAGTELLMVAEQRPRNDQDAAYSVIAEASYRRSAVPE